MSFNLSAVKSFVTANLSQAAPGVLGFSALAFVAAARRSNLRVAVPKIIINAFKSAALSLAVNAAFAPLSGRFAFLNAAPTKHMISVLSALFVIRLSVKKEASVKPNNPFLPPPNFLSKTKVASELAKQEIRLVRKEEMEKKADLYRGLLVLAWNPDEGEEGVLHLRLLPSSDPSSQVRRRVKASFPYKASSGTFVAVVNDNKGTVSTEHFKVLELRAVFLKHGHKVLLSNS